jgi:hypothetical protein
MGIRERIQREVHAIRRDRAQRKGSYTWDEVKEQLMQYPSILTRAENTRYRVIRAYEGVRAIPFEIRCFVHRGKHGWSVKDNWSMDYTLAKQLDTQFAEFHTRFDGPDAFCGAPMSFVEDWKHANDEQWMEEYRQAWLDDLRTIRKGFHDYWVTQDNSWKLDMEQRMQAEKDASEGIRRSLSLMAKWWEGLWW